MRWWRPRWLVCLWFSVVLHFPPDVTCCNVREITELVQRRFRQEVAAQCGSIGDKCSFDRECCKGLECKMSASQEGVGLSCQRAVLADPDRADMAFEAPGDEGESDSAPREPNSDDGGWMTIKSEEEKEEDRPDTAEDKNDKMYPTDMLTEIENLQEKKKLKLLRENCELEKLFTEREEKELEQLRALREDAELDELRRLKELRLKRKMQLIKELKELRGLKAEDELKTMNELHRSTNASETENGGTFENTTDVQEQYSSVVDPGTALEENTETTKTISESQEPKHKQGIHEMHHKRKHHHHKRKDPHQGSDTATTSQTQNTNLVREREENVNEYNAR